MSRKLWGAQAIGAAINRNQKQAFYLLNKGLIRSAQRIGTQWVADEDDLQREFSILGQSQPRLTAREMIDAAPMPRCAKEMPPVFGGAR